MRNREISAKPQKPHNPRFMQPLFPDFLTSVAIPEAFKERLEEEEGEETKKVVLVTEIDPQQRENEWEVKIEGGRYFRDGWEEFCEHHDLKVGEFVVCTHLGNLVFHVTVYDHTTSCQRHFPPRFHHSELINETVGGRMTPKPSSTHTRIPVEVETATPQIPSETSQYSSCDVTITPYSCKRSEINLPMAFVRSNDLLKKRFQMELIDGKGKPWQVTLNYRRSCGRSFIAQGWKAFQVGNNLKPGNVIRFEILEDDRKIPAMKCYRLTNRKRRDH